MAQSPQQKAYWRSNLRLTGALLAVWVVFTFVTSAFARQLNAFTLFGFPFGFYMSAQGSLIVYILIVWIYARRMNRLDEHYRKTADRPPET